MISIKQLQAFVKVAELSSFRGAADLLHTTQPNISQRITALETALGKSLFYRQGQKIVLTEKGAQLLPQAQKVLAQLATFIQEAEAGHLHEGVLRLGVTELIVHRWLASFLQAFREAFPKIVVELEVDISANLSPRLHDRQLDLTFQSGPFQRQLSGEIALGAYDMCWVASPHLPLKDSSDFSDLPDVPIMTHAKGTKPFAQIYDYLNAHKATDLRLSPSSNMIACREMAVSQLGIACLPDALVEDFIETGLLKRVHLDWVPDPLHFAARFHDEDCPLYVREAARLGAQIAQNDGTLARSVM